MASAPDHLVEIFQTAQGSVYQCNRRNRFLVEFAGGISAFNVHDFLAFKSYVDTIDLEEMARNTCRIADVVVLMPPRTERCFVLMLTDVLHLRELLEGAKFMLKLNSMVQECLQGMPVRSKQNSLAAV
ncbi:MAG: DUF6686 family protein [Adhaeribacter sp.]